MTGIAKRIEKSGVNAIELIDKLAKPESESVLDKVADILAEAISGAKIVLKDFFKSGNAIALWCGDEFKNWILSEEFNYVPREGKPQSHDFPREMAVGGSSQGIQGPTV